MRRRGEEGGREQERMIKKLYEASLSGSLSSLMQLIEEDKLILDRVMTTYFNETPLHIAATLGHVEFAREILRRKPELATELDSEGSSPLHLASAKGQVEMVKELLRINPNVCYFTDHDGRTPLHLAAIKGRIDVMKKLIQTRPEVIDVRVDRGESILHLCVKYSRLEALKVLLQGSVSDQLELLNSKDDDGNTALHLAAAKKQREGIKLLLSKIGIEVNALNGNGFTALDVLAQSPRDMKDMDIGESLRAVGALRAILPEIVPLAIITGRDVTRTNSPHGGITSHQKKKKKKKKKNDPATIKNKYEWLERKKNSLMVVSTVIATMSFQAVLSPPGGVWQEDKTDPKKPNSFIHRAGESVMAEVNSTGYNAFLIFNTITFLASLSITLLLVSGIPLRLRIFMWILMVIMWVTMTSLACVYLLSLMQVTPLHGLEGEACNHLLFVGNGGNCSGGFSWFFGVVKLAICVWLGMVGLVLLSHTARLVLWCLRKCWKIIRQIGRGLHSMNHQNHQSNVV